MLTRGNEAWGFFAFVFTALVALAFGLLDDVVLREWRKPLVRVILFLLVGYLILVNAWVRNHLVGRLASFKTEIHGKTDMIKALVVLLCLVVAGVGYVGIATYRPKEEDLGAQLRRECESIVREYVRGEDPPWPSEKYEPLTKFCIERRAGLGEK